MDEALVLLSINLFLIASLWFGFDGIFNKRAFQSAVGVMASITAATIIVHILTP